jgi:Na+/melibiose symporter-like transporter
MTHHQNNPPATLSHQRQAAYGLAELGVSAIESFLRLYLMIFLTDSVGLPADLAGYAVAIGVFWDAFADPILGRISDKTRSPIGRRLPWMIVGTPILALSFIQLYLVEPVHSTSTMSAFWMITVLNIILNSAMTMVSIPHLALGQDLASSKAERTTLYAWRTLMTLLGLLVGIVTPVVFVALGFDATKQQASVVKVVALISVLTAVMTVISVWTSQVRNTAKQFDSAPSTPLQIARPIKILMAAFFVATLGQGLNSTWALYFYRYRLQLSEKDLGLVLIVFIVSLCATLPLWVKLAKTFGKTKLVAFGTFGLGLATAAVYPFLPPTDLAGPMVMAVVGGILLGSTGLLESLLVDVAEVSKISDAAMGQVFGFWKFVAKAARAAAIAIGGYLLKAIGYIAPANDISPEVSQNIGLLFGPVVGFFFCAAAIMIFFVREKDPT